MSSRSPSSSPESFLESPAVFFRVRTACQAGAWGRHPSAGVRLQRVGRYTAPRHVADMEHPRSGERLFSYPGELSRRCAKFGSKAWSGWCFGRILRAGEDRFAASRKTHVKEPLLTLPDTMARWARQGQGWWHTPNPSRREIRLIGARTLDDLYVQHGIRRCRSRIFRRRAGFVHDTRIGWRNTVQAELGWRGLDRRARSASCFSQRPLELLRSRSWGQTQPVIPEAASGV